MDKSEETKGVRQRRKRKGKQQVAMDIMDAMTRLIEKEGLCQLNMSKVSKESQTDVNAILRRFASLEGILKTFLYKLECRYDFRQKKNLETACRSVNDYGLFLRQMLENLRIDNSAQQALRWEISHPGFIAGGSASSRDEQIITRWKKLFEGSTVPTGRHTYKTKRRNRNKIEDRRKNEGKRFVPGID